jgi:peptide/nickel transport system substrate-binding protein
MAEQRAIDALVRDVYSGAVSRRTLLKRGAALGLATPTLMALLAACGGDDDDPTPTAAPAAADPTPVPDDDDDEETPEPDDDDDAEPTPADSDPMGEATGEIVIMQGVDSNNLDPLLRNSTPEFTVNMHVFDMMLQRDAETLEIQPNIIESWDTIDELTWEFKLVEGATFHDGTPVDAESAVFTFERASQPQIGDAGRVQSLANQIGYESAEVVDEYTFRVHTSKPAAIFPDLLTSFEICPPSHYEDDSAENLSNVAQNPMGSGPYKFVEWVRDDRVVLEANPDYWGTPPQIARVVIRPVPELSARVVALQNEEAHIIVNVAPEVVQQVEDGDNTRISSVTGGRNIFVGIRCDKEPFGDVRVRQALNYAVDWDSIRLAILEGFGERTKTIVNPPNDNPDLEAYPYDPDRARELLAEAGVPEGFEVIMDAPNGRYIKDSDLAQAVAQNFEDVGLKINLRVLEWSVYAGELLPSGNPDPLFFLGLGSPFSGEQELFYVHPDFSLNYTFWEDEEFVDLFAQLNQSVDPDERREFMYELQEIVMRECPWVFLWHQVDFYGAAADLNWEARADERIWVAESSMSI